MVRHQLRLERLQELLRKRAAIEGRMIASIRKIENAMLWAEKALEYSIQRRLQNLERHSVRNSR